jgi:hypothetical protein
MSNRFQQRLFWSVSTPLKYLGLTTDEWLISIIGIGPGLYFFINESIRWGFICCIGGFFVLGLFKKYKRVAQNFKIKSFLIAKGLLKGPSRYPNMLNKEKVGK